MSDKPDAPQKDYRDTVFLPKTDFPMKAGLAQKEPAILARWASEGLYERPAASASSCTTARPTQTATSTWAMR
jgi:isoleucyl-tRNA synthetase